jgi:hypothetical protein
MNVDWPSKDAFTMSSTRPESQPLADEVLLLGEAFQPSPYLFSVFPDTLSFTFELSAVEIVELGSGSMVSGTTPEGGLAFYVFRPPSDVTVMRVELVSLTGDADVYVNTAPFRPKDFMECNCFMVRCGSVVAALFQVQPPATAWCGSRLPCSPGVCVVGVCMTGRSRSWSRRTRTASC